MHIPRFLAVSLAAAFFLTLLLAGPAWAQNLSVEKDDNPDPIDRGDFLHYTLTVENQGSNQATNVEVIDELPSKVDFVSADPSRGSCQEGSGRTIRCDLGTLDAGDIAKVDIFVRAEETGTITNKAQVLAEGTRRDTATESTSVEAANNSGSGGGGGGGGGGDPTDPTNPVTPAQDANPTTPANTASPAAEVTTADANLNAAANRPDSGSFRCELFLRTVRDDTGALRAQYQGNEQIVQRFEQCLSEDVLAATIPDRNLPFTGGPSLPVGGGVLLLVAAALLAGWIIRR